MKPRSSACSSSGRGSPRKKSIHTYVSTMSALTRCVQIELQVELPAKLERLGVCAALCEEFKSLDQRLGDPEPSDELRFSKQRVG